MKSVIILIVILIIILGGSYLLFGRQNPEVSKDVSGLYQSPSENNEQPKNIMAVIKTNLGDIEIEFFSSKAPNTVNNFIKLASSGFYNNTKFHRVVKDFMIQGGDPFTADDSKIADWGKGGPDYVFDDEIGSDNHNLTGTIAMANRGANTNGSQFFINTVGNNFLDTKHTVFGRVINGMDVVKKIETAQTDENDRPVTPVIVKTIEIREK